MSNETEPGFEIDGRIYPVPAIPTFNMNELAVLYEQCGLTIEDWAARDYDDECRARYQQGVTNPGFKRTLMHVAYQRGNPDTPPSHVAELIGEVQVLAAMAPLLAADAKGEEEDSPKGLGTTSVPKGSSKRKRRA